MNDTVTMDIKTYNTFKNAAVKSDLIVNYLFNNAKKSVDERRLIFDGDELSNLLKLVYPERYTNKLKGLGDT